MRPCGVRRSSHQCLVVQLPARMFSGTMVLAGTNQPPVIACPEGGRLDLLADGQVWPPIPVNDPDGDAVTMDCKNKRTGARYPPGQSVAVGARFKVICVATDSVGAQSTCEFTARGMLLLSPCARPHCACDGPPGIRW